MPAQLVALNDGPSIVIDKPILLLGRHPECDVQIDSRKISRRHCCIAQVNDYLVVRDLDSTNGIRINGVRVIEGKLQPGDEVTIGSNRYRVDWSEGEVRQPRVEAFPQMAINDEVLEACDEPMPLPEPGRPVPERPRPFTPPPGNQTDNEESSVIPEDLELLPNSGSFPNAAKQ